ncbi:MAG: hypothetical protein HT579_12645 [Candidatus Accumulibacter similis]|nr:MAG: hypothetical protein HT579_12645 [Candidatus Accumulibacter similis]
MKEQPVAPSFARAPALRGRAEWHSPNAAPASLRSSHSDDIDFIDESETDEQHPQLAAARRVTLVADSHMTKSRAPRCALIDAIADLLVPPPVALMALEAAGIDRLFAIGLRAGRPGWTA